MHQSPTTTTPRGTPSRRGKSPRFRAESPTPSGSSNLFHFGDFSNKPASTFTSSLSIPVEGATAIDSEAPPDLPLPLVAEPSRTESKRAPRKSKTEALAALNNHARSSSTGPDEDEVDESLTDQYRHAPPISTPLALDMATVKTTSPRDCGHTEKPERPFGLTDCPEFYPTTEEFKDPMSYIRSISDRAKQFGICKIIPPAEWKMPFVTDTKSFRFKTRLQRLNSIEASSRAKLNFLEQLYRFHKQQGNPRVAVPTINHKPLDLWLLRKEVQKLGGYDAVSKGKKWSDLGRILGYRGIPGLSTQIKNSYTRVILPYEHFCDRARNLPSTGSSVRDGSLKTTADQSHPQSPEAPTLHHPTHPGKLSKLSTSVITAMDNSPPSSPLTATSSPLSEPADDNDFKGPSGNGASSARPRRSTRTGSMEQSSSSSRKLPSSVSSPTVVQPPVFYDKKDTRGTSEVWNPLLAAPARPMTTREQQNCEICHKKNRGEEMLLCDGCDCGFHMFCLDPPLDSIPKEQWFCFTCLSGTGGDFGFDEGAEHRLSSFQARDLEFRRMWFEAHPPKAVSSPGPNQPLSQKIGNTTVSEFDVENEFWRLVQSPHETVEIEYGADVHSTTHGSAMPTLETHPLNPYSKDPWNLNNIPIVSDSLLRFIKSDISGMTVPWTYVGMAFSTFCWHNEDHYTYSINFMHWGETKTWYGIPGEDAEKFEAAIKCEAPDLFEAQPDLLFQLVTLMNPKRVQDAGVRVFACNQRAGEFVITFPKAYHAGFNHGLNFNEAVNFALPDWLPYGRDCVQRYREHRKLPVFSHDELLITITQQSSSIKTAMWLTESLKEMTDRELNDRRVARSLGFQEKLEESDKPEDQYQCAVCKTFCYLSQVFCPCTSKVVCVEHHHLLCERPPGHRPVLRLRFTDVALVRTQAKIAERADVPSVWRNKLKKLLSESARPPLRSLRALVAESERVNYPLPEIHALKKCVTRANEWVDSANGFLIRKQSRKRSKRSRPRPSHSDAPDGSAEDPGDRPDRGLDDLYALLKEVEDLGFECPEIAALRTLAEQAEETKKRAAILLNTPQEDQEREDFLAECNRLILHGSSLNVLLNEVVEVEKIVDRGQLIAELREKLDDTDVAMTLEEVRQLLSRAQDCNLPPGNRHMQLLEAREHEGESWEDRAKTILAQPVKTIEELKAFVDLDSSTPIDPSLLDRLASALAKAKDFEKLAKAWLNPEPEAPKPKLQDVMRMVTRAEKDFHITAVKNLKETADIASDLENKCEDVLRNRFKTNDRDLFEMVEEWKSYTLSHLRIFSLPAFERLEGQLKVHYKWIKDLPWYCTDHEQPHGQSVLDDVLEWTREDDDLPPTDEFCTCICTAPVRPPPPGTQSDAVQCDHCFARFHGPCAKNDGSCPFCDHNHWNGTKHKERSWHSCYLPTILAKAPEISRHYSQHWKQLEIIVKRVDRLSTIIGQFLAFLSQPANHRADYLGQVRHYMRKLYHLQFAVSPTPDVSFGLDLAGIHRILGRRRDSRNAKKRRRPRFIFGQDDDADWRDGTRCICRGRTDFPVDLPTVKCEACHKLYHGGCVFCPISAVAPAPFTCPICCLRKGRSYQYAEVRVQPSQKEKHPHDVYVNTSEMIRTYSKEIIYKKLPPPYKPTLFVELIRFEPGQPECSPKQTTSPQILPNQQHPAVSRLTAPIQPSHSQHHHVHHPVANMQPHVAPVYPQNIAIGQHAPPPPPWSRWGTMSTPSRPPSTQRRQTIDTVLPAPPSLPRKRKHTDEAEELTRANSSSSTAPSPKRRAAMPQTPPLGPPTHPVQTLSPSLAMIVSPTNEVSPRPGYLPARNGSDGSPSIHAMKLLLSPRP